LTLNHLIAWLAEGIRARLGLKIDRPNHGRLDQIACTNRWRGGDGCGRGGNGGLDGCRAILGWRSDLNGLSGDGYRAGHPDLQVTAFDFDLGQSRIVQNVRKLANETRIDGIAGTFGCRHGE
jgi:hypothetical protein